MCEYCAAILHYPGRRAILRAAESRKEGGCQFDTARTNTIHTNTHKHTGSPTPTPSLTSPPRSVFSLGLLTKKASGQAPSAQQSRTPLPSRRRSSIWRHASRCGSVLLLTHGHTHTYMRTHTYIQIHTRLHMHSVAHRAMHVKR
jgi:hypothetical protein